MHAGSPPRDSRTTAPSSPVVSPPPGTVVTMPAPIVAERPLPRLDRPPPPEVRSVQRVRRARRGAAFFDVDRTLLHGSCFLALAGPLCPDALVRRPALPRAALPPP